MNIDSEFKHHMEMIPVESFYFQFLLILFYLLYSILFHF